MHALSYRQPSERSLYVPSLFEHPVYDIVSQAIRANGAQRPSEMAELIENPTRGSNPRERDSTPQNLQSMPAKAPRDSEGWKGLPGYPRKRARLAGRLPNGVTLSALIMKVDAGRECCFAIPRVPGTFFLRTFVESFEFPDLCETLPEIAKLG